MSGRRYRLAYAPQVDDECITGSMLVYLRSSIGFLLLRNLMSWQTCAPHPANTFVTGGERKSALTKEYGVCRQTLYSSLVGTL